MTFGEILIKMFRADAKRYKLFILCNLISIAVLFSLLSLTLNQQFMNPSIVNPMISSTIYEPIFTLKIFMVVFIPYSYSVFIKARQRDYGILLTLGMTENEVRKSVLTENLLLCAIALVSGLIVGTILSLTFLSFVRNVIGLNKIHITVSAASYKETIIYVLIIFFVSLIINFIGMFRSTVLEKIKYEEKTESRSQHNVIPIFCGVGITILAFILMKAYIKGEYTIQICTLLCVLGAILIFYNGEALIMYFQKKHGKYYIKNIFMFSDIKYYYGKNKKVFVATMCIYFEVISYIAGAAILYPNYMNNAIKYHPYHMVYCELNKTFKPLGRSEVKLITKEHKNKLVKIESIKFVRDNAKTVFCVDDVNRLLKKKYKVTNNSLIHVYPYYKNDGYEPDLNLKLKSMSFSSKKGAKEFKLEKTIVDPLLGEANCIADDIYIANKKDYEWIKVNCGHLYIGKLHLYNFSDWHKSKEIIKDTENKLFSKNKVEKGDNFFKVCSRIEAYNTGLKTANFAIASGVYLCILIYFSAIIMIHFKLKMEYKDELEKYFSLYRIGIKDTEIKEMIDKKIFIIYAVPFVYSIIISIGFIYFENSFYGFGPVGILYDVIASVVVLSIHFIVYLFYRKKYYNNIIQEVSKT